MIALAAKPYASRHQEMVKTHHVSMMHPLGPSTVQGPSSAYKVKASNFMHSAAPRHDSNSLLVSSKEREAEIRSQNMFKASILYRHGLVAAPSCLTTHPSNWQPHPQLQQQLISNMQTTDYTLQITNWPHTGGETNACWCMQATATAAAVICGDGWIEAIRCCLEVALAPHGQIQNM